MRKECSPPPPVDPPSSTHTRAQNIVRILVYHIAACNVAGTRTSMGIAGGKRRLFLTPGHYINNAQARYIRRDATPGPETHLILLTRLKS